MTQRFALIKQQVPEPLLGHVYMQGGEVKVSWTVTRPGADLSGELEGEVQTLNLTVVGRPELVSQLDQRLRGMVQPVREGGVRDFITRLIEKISGD